MAQSSEDKDRNWEEVSFLSDSERQPVSLRTEESDICELVGKLTVTNNDDFEDGDEDEGFVSAVEEIEVTTDEEEMKSHSWAKGHLVGKSSAAASRTIDLGSGEEEDNNSDFGNATELDGNVECDCAVDDVVVRGNVVYGEDMKDEIASVETNVNQQCPVPELESYQQDHESLGYENSEEEGDKEDEGDDESDYAGAEGCGRSRIESVESVERIAGIEQCFASLTVSSKKTNSTASAHHNKAITDDEDVQCLDSEPESESEWEFDAPPPRPKSDSSIQTPVRRNERPRRAAASNIKYKESPLSLDSVSEGETDHSEEEDEQEVEIETDGEADVGEDIGSEDDDDEEENEDGEDLDRYESSFVVTSEDDDSADDDSYEPSNQSEEDLDSVDGSESSDDNDSGIFTKLVKSKNRSSKTPPSTRSENDESGLEENFIDLSITPTKRREPSSDNTKFVQTNSNKENVVNNSHSATPKSQKRTSSKSILDTSDDAILTARNRSLLTQDFFLHFNKTVFANKLPSDLPIQWNNRLRKTAGTTHTSIKANERISKVELSEKVLHSVGRLKATLLHELCHVAAWHVNGVAKPPHGEVFNSWAKLASARFPDLEVTTCHSYEIHAKYLYECVDCRAQFRRHSKSINVKTQACGRCKGLIEFKGTFGSDGKPLSSGKPSSAYQQFLKKNFKAVRAKFDTQAETMKEIARMWRSQQT